MVQILPPPVLFLFFLIVPSFSAPLPSEDVDDIALREPSSNELISRKIHVHLPKVHLPHIDGNKVLEGLRKWAPKIGKTIFKIVTKLILREETSELEGRSFDSILTERDIDDVDDIHELIARSPKKTLKKLLKAAKKLKKYAKAEVKLAAAMETDGDFVERSESLDIECRDEDEEYYSIALELEGSDIDVREFDKYLETLVRGLEDLMLEGREYWGIHGHWAEQEGLLDGRDDDEGVYERQGYQLDWELEDLD